jgi:hypothetical protein
LFFYLRLGGGVVWGKAALFFVSPDPPQLNFKDEAGQIAWLDGKTRFRGDSCARTTNKSPGMSAFSIIGCRGRQAAQSHPEVNAECRVQSAESQINATSKPP